MALRVGRLRAVKRQILAHPENYDQSNWCGTECCIAGIASQHAGLKWRNITNAFGFAEFKLPGKHRY